MGIYLVTIYQLIILLLDAVMTIDYLPVRRYSGLRPAGAAGARTGWTGWWAVQTSLHIGELYKSKKM